MAKRALIFGSGGHAHVIASLLHGRYAQIDFLVEHAQLGGFTQADFFRRVDDYRRTSDVYIGIGENQARRRIFDHLIGLGITPASCVSAFSFVAHDAELGAGIVVCPGAIIMSRARVGDNVIVNTHSSVDHDCWVGNHTQITVGVTFGGQTRVGESCFFGVKSATIPGVTVGDRVFVMAGALVTKDVPSDVTMGGAPARIVRRIE